MLRTRIILSLLSALKRVLNSGYKSSASKATKIYDQVDQMKAQATDIIQKGEKAKAVADKLNEIL